MDPTKNDWMGAGENGNQYVSNNKGVVQFWNFSGPDSVFKSGSTPIPCYGVQSGCNKNVNFANPALIPATAVIAADCVTAAQAPYAGNATLQALAVQALVNNSCYVQNGAFLTPPAYGTNGNAGRNSFRGPNFYNVDFSVSKSWHLGREGRYSAQFRAEFFNLFNWTTVGSPGTDPTKGLNGQFGWANSTADSSNPVFGSGGPRHIQFGLKLAF
jgi:hypothetical protein